MSRRKNRTIWLVSAFALSAGIGLAEEQSRPNFVFIFADDLGYRDLVCYGHPYAKTPTLDQLASEGTRFIQAYAAGPTCMPSRTGIMTGRSVARFAKRPDDFDFGDRPTVTELLKKSGYSTGHFGKWHIGMDRSNGVYGIDENDGGGKPDIDSPKGRDAQIFDAAIDFIKRNKDKPFYVNIWGFTTHHPVVVFSSDQGPQRPNGIGENATGPQARAEVKKHRDGSIKRPSPYHQNMLGDTGEFRGNKGTIREGGLRIPFIIRWPGKVKAGVVDETDVVAGYDWLPSICKLAGATGVPDDLDGEDVSDIWLGSGRVRNQPLIWGSRTSIAVRDGKWKYYLSLNAKNRITVEELYDLLEDPAERADLAEKHPDVVDRLKEKAVAFQSELPENVESTGKYKHQRE